VLGQGLRLAALGIMLGLFGASVATRALQNLLFGISPTDPATFVTTPLLLALVVLCACWFPARRATRVDPMVALRSE
jgi:putative ABC transport system permease protein